MSRPRAVHPAHRLPQFDHRHGVAAAPVVARDSVEVAGAGHVAGGGVAVLQFHQGQQAWDGVGATLTQALTSELLFAQ